jgi:hypothetical protein
LTGKMASSVAASEAVTVIDHEFGELLPACFVQADAP